MDFEAYSGSLIGLRNCKSKSEIFRAYASYYNQLKRCNDPKNKAYKHYGEKGIRVEYSLREFIGWWIFSINNFKGKRSICGRIDHSKNYSFNNICLQDWSENSKESAKRNDFKNARAHTKKKISVLDVRSGFIIDECESIKAAAKKYSVDPSLIKMYAKGILKSQFCKKLQLAFVFSSEMEMF